MDNTQIKEKTKELYEHLRGLTIVDANKVLWELQSIIGEKQQELSSTLILD